MAQFSLRRKGWWHEGHPTVKQMPGNKNVDQELTAVATPNWEKPKDNYYNSVCKDMNLARLRGVMKDIMSS